MNAAVRATVRVGLYTGAKVYFVHEVGNHKSSVMLKYDLIYRTCRPFTVYDKHMKTAMKTILVLSMCASGLPGPGGWRRKYSDCDMGECFHDASAGELMAHVDHFMSNHSRG